MTASRPGSFKCLGEIGRRVADAVFLRRLLGLVEFAPDKRNHFDAVDVLDRVEMLQAKSPGAGERGLDGDAIIFS